MFIFHFKKIYVLKKKKLNLVSNLNYYTSFFYNIDFPVLVSCRQIVKKNLRNIYGQFYIGPFFVGQGLTVANALRRTLLSELSTLAITSILIENVSHQYQSIKGLQESVFDLLMNFKEIVFYSNKFVKYPQIGYLQVQGPCIIKAKNLLLPSYIQCVDPEQYIGTLSDDGFLNIKFILRQGKSSIIHSNFGFAANIMKNNTGLSKNIDGQESLNLLNKLPKNLTIDSSFNSIIKVNYMIELLDFDKFSSEKENTIIKSNNRFFYEKEKNNYLTKEIVVLEIWTDGSISPVLALKKSIKKLIGIFYKLQNSKILKKSNSNESISYLNFFEKVNKEYNILKYKQSQTLSEFKGLPCRTTDGLLSDISLIKQLKYLINQLE